MDSHCNSTDKLVEALTQRVTVAEEQIRQLIELTNSMRNEIAAQQRIINVFTTISAERKLSNPKNETQAVPGNVEPNASNIAALEAWESNIGILDAWEFSDSMDLDWDSLNVSAMNSSTNVTVPNNNKTQALVNTRYHLPYFAFSSACLHFTYRHHSFFV